MLSFALFRSLGHGLVQRFDPCLQSLDLLGQCGDAILRNRDGSLRIGEGMLKALLLVVSQIELCTAVLFLLIVIHLLLLQVRHHAINHGDDLLKTGLLAMERHHEELEAAAVTSRHTLHCVPRHHQGTHLPRAHAPTPHLHEAGSGSWQSLLEEVKGVVIIQNLDCLCQGGELIGARLHPDVPLRGLCSAALIEICEELFVLKERLLCGREVILHLLDCNAQLADLLGLLLDGSGEGRQLLLLGGHECFVGGDGALLRGSFLREALCHLIAQLLQDSGDLAALRRVFVALLAREEGQETLPVHVGHLASAAEGQLPKGLRQARLQEAPCCTLLESGDSALDGGDVGIVLGLLCGISRSLLLPDRSGLRHVILRSSAVHLCLLEFLFRLRLLLARSLYVIAHRRRLSLGSSDALAQRTPACLAVALELLIKLLLLFTLCHDLRLHCLEHGHHLPDRVCGGGRAFTLFDGLQCQRRGH
mmetsp:Transcript_50375/g.107923  ORF Transcript_50375/g.107923 Transcript_50375/m.107923 type:complete len:476 (-) Transcript_50375:133-1560(-)